MREPTPTTTTSSTATTTTHQSPTALDADDPPVSEQVIAAIAAATDTDPTEMEPLYRFIDPDSLDALFDDSDANAAAADGRVTFSFAGCNVVVRQDETVAVTPYGASEPAYDTATDALPPLPHTAPLN